MSHPLAPGAAKIPATIWVLVAATFLIGLGYGLIAPILPQFAHSFNVSLAAASAAVSIISVTRLLFGPLAGPVLDRWGSRPVYLYGLLLIAVSTGAVAFAQAYWQVMLLRAISGIGSVAATVSAMALVVKLAPVEIRGRCASAYASATLLGTTIGPVIGAFMAPLGMRVPFAIYGAMIVIATGFVARYTSSISLQDEQQSQYLDGKLHLPIMSFWEALKHKSYVASLVGAFANGWTSFGIRVTAIPLFAAVTFENNRVASSAMALASFAIGNAICLQFAGRAADKIGRKPLIILGLIGNGVFTGLLANSENLWSLCILSACAGAGVGIYNPAQQAVVADIIGNQRSGGRVLAGFQMSQDLGATIGPVAVGLIATKYSFEIGFLITGAIMLVAAFQWLFAPETLPFKTANQ
ncbi:MFS transporter [Corynebacterium caspium]|uniref:MFS transporter n=1 Tax=Corynebacterium caspium TaxID=234828 RepID=UPI00038110E8|nr:MFS transporter [Corynebacterium caspium]WKD59494.1 Tetracycline resistance protein, class B [Corynebacterium caspium DSM 44850]